MKNPSPSSRRHTRHAVSSIAVLAAAGLFLSSCSTAATPTAEKSDGPLIIGAALALSGSFATFDKEPLQALQMYAEKLNSEGGINGRQVQVVTADTKSDPSAGPTAAQSVLSQGAEIVLVSCDFDYGSPAAVTAAGAGKVAISQCAGSPKFGPSGLGPLTFTMGLAAQVEGAAAAQFMIDKGWKTAYILKDTSIQYQGAFTDAFKDAYAHLGGTVTGEDSFSSTDSSLSSQMAKLSGAASTSNAILVPAVLPLGATAVREIRAAGINLPILSNSGMDGESWFNQVPNLKDFYVSNNVSNKGDDPDDAVNQARTDYTQKYGAAPSSPFAYYGYATLQVLDEAITKAGTTEGTKLAETMETLNKFPTLVGPTTFTKTDHISLDRTVKFKEAKDGSLNFITELTPTYVPKP